jgi:DNA-binding NarL/FixJ family response regulator
VTRVVVAADSGPVLAGLTAAVGTVAGTYIVRHGSSSSPLDRLVAPLAPDLVVIGALVVPTNALARVGEVRRAAPAASIVVLTSAPSGSWLADALRARACAVLPGHLEPDGVGDVLREVLAARSVPSLPLRAPDGHLPAEAAA